MNDKKTNDSGSVGIEPEALFNSLLNELSAVVEHASYNADTYRNQLSKIDAFTIESDKEEIAPMPLANKSGEPTTVTSKLRFAINQLKTSNQKNDEILQHLNSIIQ
jgi:hypothetical protein